jgi:pimeloyl-ACP methyl ester carboxylesterase
MPTTDINGVRLTYDDRGSGTPVLLIHGTAASTWGELPDRLIGRRVIVYDRRGFGASRADTGAPLTRHAADAAKLLTALDAAPAIVIGWSIGGVIALELAATRPELVVGLVIIDAPLHAKLHPRPRMVRALIGAQILARRRRPERGARCFLRWACRNTRTGRGFEDLPSDARAAMLDNGPAIVAELRTGTGEHLGRRQLAEIATPIIWLTAEASDGVFRRAAQRAGRILPHCEVQEVPHSAHAMQFDRPDSIVQAVDGISTSAAAPLLAESDPFGSGGA